MSDNFNENALHKEIDLIQGCINRMAHNSFIIKGWAITLVLAVLAFTANIEIKLWVICGLTLLPLLTFWYLDGFFLYVEQLYIAKYSWVIKNRPKNNDHYLYNLNPYINYSNGNKIKQKIVPFSTIFSKTLLPFYLILLMLITFIVGFSYNNCTPEAKETTPECATQSK